MSPVSDQSLSLAEWRCCCNDCVDDHNDNDDVIVDAVEQQCNDDDRGVGFVNDSARVFDIGDERDDVESTDER